MPQCSAITSALAAKGYDSTQLASKTGLTTQRVNEILSGSKATQQEFSSISQALGISSNPKHAAEVTI